MEEQLYAEGRTGGTRSVLLVLQGMDTSGKGGTVRHVVGQCDPAGLHIASFGRPTPEELEHEFLWRIRRQLPRPGLEDRALWPAYMAAYADALECCSTGHAPWHIVPADRKWYRNWAITELLIEHFEALDLRWPEADYDVEEQRRRLQEIP